MKWLKTITDFFPTAKKQGLPHKSEEVRAFLGQGASFCGKMIFQEAVRIDGNYEGEIYGEGTLVIGEGATIKAEIRVGKVLISGNVYGHIVATEKVEIFSPGRLWGDIQAACLEIHKGAIFEGNSRMMCGPEEGASAGGAPRKETVAPNG